jgi:hypothetical protein
MVQSSSEDDNRSASEEIIRFLWYANVHYSVQENQQLISILREMNPVHTHILQVICYLHIFLLKFCMHLSPLMHATCPGQAVSRRLLTAETRNRVQVAPCAICGGQVALGQIFSESFSFPLLISLHRCSIFTHVSSEGWTMSPLAAHFHRDTVPPHRNNKKDWYKHQQNSGRSWRN